MVHTNFKMKAEGRKSIIPLYSFLCLRYQLSMHQLKYLNRTTLALALKAFLLTKTLSSATDILI